MIAAGETVLALLPDPARQRRHVWRDRNDLHIEARGIHHRGGGQLCADLVTAVQDLAGVDGVVLNRVRGEVIVRVGSSEIDPARDIVDAIQRTELAHEVADEPFADRHDHPGDPQSLQRDLLGIAADGAALGVAAAGRLAHLARIPIELASFGSVVQSQPKLRVPLESAVGVVPAQASLAVMRAVGTALGQGWFSLLGDITLRATSVAEQLASRSLWREVGDEIPAEAEPVETEPRPVPLRPGPVDEYCDRASIAGLATGVAAALTTANPRRGYAMLLATTPKAAVHGQHAFAAHVGRLLAERKVLALARWSLRNLDRLDCLVVDGSIVGTEQHPEHAVAGVIARAREASWMVAVIGDDEVAIRLEADLRLDLPPVDAVRMLQEDGCGVALLAADTAALAAADLGIAVWGDAIPWTADVVCRSTADVEFVITASGVAHEISRQSVAIALGASSVGALLGFAVPAPAAGARAMVAVNFGALLAQANALRAAVGLGRLPLPTTTEAPPWHEFEPEQVLDQLGTSLDGLPTKTVSARHRTVETSTLSLPAAVIEELANPLTPVLAGAAALSSAVGSATDAVIVSSVTALNATLGGLQRWRADRAVRGLEEASSQQVRVRRNGEVVTVPADSLVVGDVLLLQAGDSVPADCRLLDGSGLELDESGLTGESVPVTKARAPVSTSLVAERTSMLYDGTTIAAGEAEAVVVAVGDDTEAGAAAATADDESVTSGVEVRLSQLTGRALPISAVGGGIVTLAGLLRGVPMRETLHGGVSLAVAAVPEGLPLLATMAQISAARRMAAHDTLVRNPRAIEALGRVDVVCADKTGTLTEGRIELRRVSDGERTVDLDSLSEHHRHVLVVALRASPEERQDDDPLPHLTDRAVVEGAMAAGAAADDGGAAWERHAELPFEPARGYHAVLGRNGEGFLLSVKGAPEVVLPRCDEWDDGERVRSLADGERDEVAARIEAFAREGYRVLAVAERRATSRRDLDDDRVARLQLLGFVGLADPVRPAAADAVERLAAAGVRTVMITGDHPSTAEGIAAELGILNSGDVVTGGQLDELDDDALRDVIDGATVFARVTPSQKLRLVAAYQAAGHSVAMTGDGANDAPAIRRADVGIAVGEHSTSGARRAADIVVPNGRIEVLLDAIVEGRAMWASVREAVALLLGGNLGETAFTAAGAVLTGRPPLNPRQLLLVNLLTDALPAMAIATRRPRDLQPEQLLMEGPEASLGRSLDNAVLARAVTTAGAAAAAWLAARATGLPARASSVALAALVGAQLGQTLLSGGHEPMVLAASLGSVAVLVAAVQTPGLSRLFGCTPLDPLGWGIAVTASAGAVAVSPLVSRAVTRMAGSNSPPALPERTGDPEVREDG